jgi:osmotically-inducible protein OsmY
MISSCNAVCVSTSLTLKLHMTSSAFSSERYIRPIVRQRNVTLEGTVNFPNEREEAELAVRRLKEVVGVTNAITIARGVDAVKPAQIRRRVEESLRSSVGLDASTIKVEARGG